MNLLNKSETKKKSKKVLDHSWIIVGYDTCGYTQKAINRLKNEDDVIYINIWPYDKANEGNIVYFERNLKPIAKQFDPTHETYPYIFHNKKFVGGFSDLESHMEGMEKKKNKFEKLGNVFDKFIGVDDENETEDDDDDMEMNKKVFKFLAKRKE